MGVDIRSVRLLGSETKVAWSKDGDGVRLAAPAENTGSPRMGPTYRIDMN